mmetsp:Transcript_40930/g.76123  ORF Transcript_40930/g.76123 Transcript_40930/m.76123 type:complete len:89 (+) Transcript_40930:410-676(+)
MACSPRCIEFRNFDEFTTGLCASKSCNQEGASICFRRSFAKRFSGTVEAYQRRDDDVRNSYAISQPERSRGSMPRDTFRSIARCQHCT